MNCDELYWSLEQRWNMIFATHAALNIPITGKISDEYSSQIAFMEGRACVAVVVGEHEIHVHYIPSSKVQWLFDAYGQ